MNLVPPNEAIKPVQPVTQFPVDPAVIEEMKQIMWANNGVGLAAPQVGIYEAFCLVQLPLWPEPAVLCNPKVKVLGKLWNLEEEGCLTLPGEKHLVRRAQSIRVDFQDNIGTDWRWSCNDLLAEIIQHESDHLNGRLINAAQI